MKYSDIDPRLAEALKVAKGDKKPAPNGAASSKAVVIPLETRSRDELETAAASSFKMRGIRWLWPLRFAIGKLGLIGGLPDKGKGLISCNIIASVTANEPLPCNEGYSQQGSVIWLTAEDDIEDTVVPRLVAAGADLDRVHIVKMMHDKGKRRMFSLITDIGALKRKIEQIGDVALIIIDPMTAYLGVGQVNNSQTTDVRGFLTPLTDLAAEKHVAIIGIMHFNKKADVTNAMLRIADSLAYVAAARHVYVVVDDVEVEHRRLFVKAKNNLSPDNNALSYMTGARKVGEDEETGEEIFAPHIIWGAEHVKVTATEAMQAEAEGGHSKRARSKASEFLQSRLAGGPVMADDLRDEAEANGISWRTVQRAKKELNIDTKKERGDTRGKWLWSLPTPPRQRHADD